MDVSWKLFENGLFQGDTQVRRLLRVGTVWMCLLMVMTLFSTGCGVKEGEVEGVTTLRSEYKTLDDDQAIAVLKKNHFYDRRWNKGESFPNKFQLKEVSGDKIVIDLATNLVWHPAGSETQMTHQEAEEWIKNLNKKGYAGYHNWRLPTLEEAASLVEGKRIKKRNIDSLFSLEHHSTLTGDIYSQSRFWGVSYHYGGLFRIGIIEPCYVKPVTTYLPQKSGN
jgi:hypothetical protein